MIRHESAGADGLLPHVCGLCPRRCGADRAAGEAGLCGADGSLQVARAALHYWEEPPVSGDAGSGAVFFSHCPLRCVYCQNADIAAGRAGDGIAVGRLADICLELAQQGALNINFVTPTHYAPLVRAAVAQARAGGLALPIVWNTSGYETVEAVRQNAGTVDVYLTDFKYADGRLAARYSNAPDYPQVALAALDQMVAQVGAPVLEGPPDALRLVRGVVVRHLLLPGCLEDSKRVVELVHGRYGTDVLLSLMNQYTPVIDLRSAAAARFPELLCRTSNDAYEQLLDFADGLGVQDYFWQQGPAAEESFIPPFDLTGVHGPERPL